MILMYHNIDHRSKFNTVSVDNFQQQLAFIRSQDFECLPFDDYVDRVLRDALPKNALTLTFDDVYVGVPEFALPLMEEYRIYSAWFVPTGHVGGQNGWDLDETDERFQVMDWKALQAAANHELITIGSHTVSHPNLGTLSDEEQFHEVFDSKKALEEHLGIEVKYFAYPYGQLKNFNAKTVELLKDAGYVASCSTLWSIYNQAKDRYKLNRIDIDQHDTLDVFKKKLTQQYHPKYFNRLIKDVIYGW